MKDSFSTKYVILGQNAKGKRPFGGFGSYRCSPLIVREFKPFADVDKVSLNKFGILELLIREKGAQHRS